MARRRTITLKKVMAELDAVLGQLKKERAAAAAEDRSELALRIRDIQELKKATRSRCRVQGVWGPRRKA